MNLVRQQFETPEDLEAFLPDWGKGHVHRIYARDGPVATILSTLYIPQRQFHTSVNLPSSTLPFPGSAQRVYAPTCSGALDSQGYH